MTFEGPAPVVALDGVAVRRAGRTILGPVDWTIGPGERWAVVGPNGSGKTTLLQVLSTYLWPTRGRVRILGDEMGTVDARELRRRIGYASQALAAAIDPALPAIDVVMTARHAALAPWWHRFEEADRERAQALLEQLGIGAMTLRTFGTLSSGERQRTQIARTLMTRPDLLLLDEPAAGLDLGAREALLRSLTALAADPALPAIVLVTHHVEEIPTGFGHALLLADGRAQAAGRIGDVLTSAELTGAYGLPLEIEGRAGRFRAWSV
jgi:iron complex transport system ATP-binding protein